MKKPRPDSSFAQLTEDQRLQLNHWLQSNTYERVRELLARPAPEGFDLQVSPSALQRYYVAHMPEFLAQQRHLSLAKAKHLRASLQAEPPEFDAVTLDCLKQRVFEMSINPSSNPADLCRLYRLILKAKDQRLAREKFHTRVVEQILLHFDDIKEFMPVNPEDEIQAERSRIRLVRHLFGRNDPNDALQESDIPPDMDERIAKMDQVFLQLFGDFGGRRIVRKPFAYDATRNAGLQAEHVQPNHETEPPAVDYCTADQSSEVGASAQPSINSPPSAPACIAPQPAVAEQPELPRPLDTPSPAAKPAAFAVQRFALDAIHRPAVTARPPQAVAPPIPEFFEPDPTRECRLEHGADSSGLWTVFTYADGQNPQGRTKYQCDVNGRLRRRAQQ